MKGYLYSKIFIWHLLLALAIFIPAGGFAETDHEGEGTVQSGGEEAEQQIITLQVPLFSVHFAETPVALVNDTPITLNELADALKSPEEEVHEHTDEELLKEYKDVLQRLIQSRLIVLEARNIGLDETSWFKADLEEFKVKTLLKELISIHLEGLEADPADIKKVYEQISREVQLYTLIFEKGSDAQQFRNEVEEADFDQLAAKYIEQGLAKGEKSEEYVKIKDLLPMVGQQVYSMKTGDVSTVYRAEDGFVLFQLVDARFTEDPPVREEAVRIVMETLRKQKAMEYGNALTEKYVDFNEELYNQIDFNQDLDKLKKDGRVLATVKGDVPRRITVGDFAAKMEEGFFHGADKAQKLEMLNKRKDIVITNMLFRITGEIEARRLGLDETEEYKEKVDSFERSLLFKAFMERVILPEVQLTADEVKAYYDEHLEDYSSPAMLRMKSLVFKNREDAESALDKLRKGADFKWVSANATGFVPPDTEDALPFERNLLSLTALPEGLQEKAEGAKKGDALFYDGPEDDYFYVLYMQEVYPPKPQPYEEAKDEVAKTLFDIKAQQLVDEWVGKLKEVYDTQIYLTGLKS